MRGMRGIGLVLVDERRGRGWCSTWMSSAVPRMPSGPGSIGGPRQHHEVGRAARLTKSGSSGLSGMKISAAAALGDEIEAVIEELAEEGHPLVEGQRQAKVGRHVVELEHLEGAAIGPVPVTMLASAVWDRSSAHRRRCEDAVRAGIERGRVSGWIGGGLVHDQVGDGARLRVEHKAVGLGVGDRRIPAGSRGRRNRPVGVSAVRKIGSVSRGRRCLRRRTGR